MKGEIKGPEIVEIPFVNQNIVLALTWSQLVHESNLTDAGFQYGMIRGERNGNKEFAL